jgi:hypothetical protein
MVRTEIHFFFLLLPLQHTINHALPTVCVVTECHETVVSCYKITLPYD